MGRGTNSDWTVSLTAEPSNLEPSSKFRQELERIAAAQPSSQLEELNSIAFGVEIYPRIQDREVHRLRDPDRAAEIYLSQVSHQARTRHRGLTEDALRGFNDDTSHFLKGSDLLSYPAPENLDSWRTAAENPDALGPVLGPIALASTTDDDSFKDSVEGLADEVFKDYPFPDEALEWMEAFLQSAGTRVRTALEHGEGLDHELFPGLN